MGASVTLVCRGCGRRMPYFRSNDPSLPAWVETISMSGCDLCHDGDRMSEDWLDADGNAPDPIAVGYGTPHPAILHIQIHLVIEVGELLQALFTMVFVFRPEYPELIATNMVIIALVTGIVIILAIRRLSIAKEAWFRLKTKLGLVKK